MSSGCREFYCRSKIVSGVRALENIPLELKGYGRERPLVVLNNGEAGKVAGGRFADALGDSGITVPAYMEMNGTGTSVAVHEECAALFNERRCDSVIAVGGASALNLARAISYSVSGGEEIVNPLFFVPGTGARDTDMGNKAVIGGEVRVSDCFIPDVVFIDSGIGSTDNIIQAMDAALSSFCRAVDGLAGDPHPLRDAFRTASISLLYRDLPVFLKKPGNSKARTAVINGIIHGGIALHNDSPGIVHHLADSLNLITGFPSYAIMAFLLPRIVDWRTVNGFQPDMLYRAMAGVEGYCAASSFMRKNNSAELLRDFMDRIGGIMPGSLGRVSLTGSDIRQAAEKAGRACGMSRGQVATMAEHLAK